jgi:hypothetical protein
MKNSLFTCLFGCALAAGCGQSSSPTAPATSSSPVVTSPSAGQSATVAPTGGSAAVTAPPVTTAGTRAAVTVVAGTSAAAGTSAGSAGVQAAAVGGGGDGASVVVAGTGAGAGGAAVVPDPPGTVTLTTDQFLLKADQEIYKCQNFDNPFGSKDTAIQRVTTDMSQGSHHLHVYHMTTSATRTLEDCDINDFHPLLFAAAQPHAEQQYPAGMAAKLLGTAGIRIQLHYINTSGHDLTVNAVLKLTPVDYSTVTKWVSELYFNQLSVSVPPGDGKTISTTCAIPSTYGPIGLVAGGTHMHKQGVHFTATTSTGVTLADVTSWDDPPPINYDPPIMMNPGDTITWTCTYDNPTANTLVFGESAETNEMCIYLGRFFSAPDGAQLECQAMGATGTTSSRTY